MKRFVGQITHIDGVDIHVKLLAKPLCYGSISQSSYTSTCAAGSQASKADESVKQSYVFNYELLLRSPDTAERKVFLQLKQNIVTR
ncbi:hypothetical protein AVEN_169990-1 [Araneus ventricosus]|uniref:Uncharacterized protein n=1 Tax=Araneus ventricosus TaxID=182803 RepID=A0A4Y2KL09_ARAVE|nr:hypothetical protein AVEN_169990-1 [Araneus ventricosus]